ncbi:uncharacterized protein LOC144434849 [Glandiceps talaboti]
MAYTRTIGVGVFSSIIHSLLLIMLIVNIYGGNAERSGEEQQYSPQFTIHDDVPHEWQIEMYPNPQNDSTGLSYSCGHGLNTSWICDPNEILSNQEAGELNEIAENIRLTTTCVCSICDANNTNNSQLGTGYVVAIAIVNRMEAEYINQGCPTRKELVKEADKWATYLRTTRWQFGDCGNDVIILYSKEENVIVTSTGEKTAEVLQASHIQHLYSKAHEYLDSHEYFKGLKFLLQQYNRTLVTGEGAHGLVFTPLQLYFIVFTAVVVPCMIFVVVFINCYDPNEYKYRKRRRDIESSETESFKSCPERI